jgi:glutathione S-transferase
MIEVHHLNNSRSQRVLWLLEELGLDYRLVRYQRDASTMLAPPELRSVHKLGKSPVIRDGDLVLAESGAIIQYLVDRYGAGGLAPERGSPEYVRFLYWMHYAEGSAMPPLFLKLVIGRLGILGMPARGFVNRNVKNHLDFMEGELASAPYFVGDRFSAADIQMSFPLEAAAARAGLANETYPRLFDLLGRLHARPAYQRAIEKGGPFKLGA